MNALAQDMAASPSSVTGGSLHHVGFVVESIQETAKDFALAIGGDWDGKIIHDPLQVVRVSFLRSHLPTDPLFELMEPAGPKSPVLNFLKRGGGLHHLCYEVDVLDKQLELSRSAGGLIVRPPLPAVAFAGRRIAWVYSKHKLLLEYLER
jgi:methylmalonyl-CoA/ethylmalonyl-CoA epimerase